MKHSFTARILCLVLFLMCLPLHTLAYDPVSGELLYVVNNPRATDRLNLRTMPKESAPSLGRYYNGVRLEALSQPSNGWIHVRVDASDITGYMQTAYLIHNPSRPVASAIPTGTINNRNGTGLNLRAGRSTASTNYGFFPNGMTVSVLAWGATWHHVQIENQTGYMLASGLIVGTTASGDSPAIAYAYVRNPDPTDRLNLRASVDANGLAGASLGKYYSGVEVEILEYLTRGNTNWARVRIGAAKRIGYMQVDFLAIDAMPYQVESAMPIVDVKNPKPTDHLNLRVEPNEKTASLGRYSNGTKVVVLGVVNGAWSHVRVDGVEGFMMNIYLSPMPSFMK